MEVSQDKSEITSLRLGLCEVCAFVDAKYTCPKCEVKTCCLKCLNIHKKELDCNGIRDKTKFIPIKNMTEMDFNSDYTFLEECTRYVSDRKRDTMKRFTRFNKNLPAHMFKLRCAAHERRTTLRFLLALFSKHAQNTTFYDWKSKVIHWRVEWVFPNASNVKFSDDRCDEGEPLHKLLDKYVRHQPENVEQTDAIRRCLEYYQARGGGLTQMRVLLKAEGVKKSKNRFFELDVELSLKENLAGKTIVEFPCIYVVYDDVVKEFDVIDSDDDIDRETELYQKEVFASSRSRPVNESGPVSKEELSHQTKKRREERRQKREKLAKHPTNLLFTDELALDEMSSDTDSGEQTEEEVELIPSKKLKIETD